jgi:hypothetical protein
MRIEHTLPPNLIHHRAVRVLVIGAGGTGSAIVMGLPYLDQAMRVWGHRYGIEVAMMDADKVSKQTASVNLSRPPTSARTRPPCFHQPHQLVLGYELVGDPKSLPYALFGARA